MFAVLVPVGPGSAELARLADALDSIRAFEAPGNVHLVLVDDATEARELRVTADEWASLDVVRTALWDGEVVPDPYSAMVAGTIDGMRAAASRRPRFVLKLDTDALAIAPFAAKLSAVTADPKIGVVGSYTHTCTGAERDWSGWEPKLRRAAARFSVGRKPLVRYRRGRDVKDVRRLMAQARDHGYIPGAHCLGGAYVVGPSLLQRIDLLDWTPWVRTGLGEDVVVGILAAAANLSIRGFVEPGDAFGIAWQELPLAPEDLLSRGYSVIHSVRDQAYGSEAHLRGFFRAHRKLRNGVEV